jgi:hypothetical protein
LLIAWGNLAICRASSANSLASVDDAASNACFIGLNNSLHDTVRVPLLVLAKFKALARRSVTRTIGCAAVASDNASLELKRPSAIRSTYLISETIKRVAALVLAIFHTLNCNSELAFERLCNLLAQCVLNLIGFGGCGESDEYCSERHQGEGALDHFPNYVR